MWWSAKTPEQLEVNRSLARIPLPEPNAGWLPPPGGDSRDFERMYFDPEKWDADLVNHLPSNDEDPVRSERGQVEGQGSAALFLSDFHIGDGTAGGDDFLESHLHPDDQANGLYTGFFPAGESRAMLFLSVLTFAFERIAQRAGASAKLDVVLNGDIINFLELKGRGGTYVSRRHALFFRGLAKLRTQAEVIWLRGNHDYVVPAGPWRGGEYYVNPILKTLAEHGDFWDSQNWPPGPTNKGSRLAIDAGSAFEAHGSVTDKGVIKYLLSGIDNLRPWNNAAVEGFLDRRAKYCDVAAFAAALARLKYVGAADDSAAYQGALERRKGPYADWLMVQGHTHVPAAKTGVYYNLGTWISTLVAQKGIESQIEAFPFLLVYVDPAGQRVEEYFIVERGPPGATPQAVLQTPASVNELRRAFGYKDMPS